MGERKKSEASSILKQALAVNRKPFPWLKAFSAGLAASLPVIIGLLFGHLEYGLIAGLGGFTYLYVFNIPYAQRAKKLFFVVLGMTFVTVLGTITAPYPLAVAILMGVIGATALFIFGALRIAGPTAIFFVLVFAMTSGMTVDPELALIRAGLVFVGGSLSWVIAMIGWFFNPHGPEEDVINRVYLELAVFIDSVGTGTFDESRHSMMSVLNDSNETLTVGFISWWETDLFKRLYLLNQQANTIFTYILNHFLDTREKLPPELGQMVRELAHSFNRKETDAAYKRILQPSELDEEVSQLFSMVYDADALMNEPVTKINQSIQISKLSAKTRFGGAFDKNSIVFITALRFGFITIIAAIIAFELDLARSYWVPLSCVAVMSGATIVSTHHRAIQRGIGTVIGILIASLILALEPSGYIIAIFVLILTFITELFIVKNYGLAALFFTPNALLMAESTSEGSFSFAYFASARIIDVIIGSMIGLIGVWLVGRKSASSRIPHLITKTIRSQAQLLLVLFSELGDGFSASKSEELKKMRINIMNLKTMYNTASGEIPVNREALDYYWTVIFSIEHLGFLLEDCSKMEKRPILSDTTLSQLLYACEMMANAANQKCSPSIKNIPDIEGLPSVQRELIHLQKALISKI
ncbi:putative membrane protein YccC [Neobacillus niacini]|uniref:FUSC family protein n=1 Tax=Neobacillus niacini TaxID=86668 RepID=UPI0028628E53|nr:FUSC family protein [Neobacillus niacini]MDR7079259.1 putative membrane protein YccC [Neobacillus niacini]